MSPSSSRMPYKRTRLPSPTEEGTRNTIAMLQSLLIHHAEAETRLAQVEAEVEERRRDHARLERKIFHCRAVIAPIRRVPIPVLAYIFEFIVATSPDAIAWLSGICRDWWMAAQFPRLWSTLHLDENIPGAQKARIFLDKSGQVPLDITYTQTIPNQMNLQVAALPWVGWNTINGAAPRWRFLSLEFKDSNAARDRISNLGYAPRLAELDLSIRDQCGQSRFDGNFGLHRPSSGNDTLPASVPRLHTLRLRTFILPSAPGMIFQQLTTLHITDTFSQLESPIHNPMNSDNVLKILNVCCNLREFSLDGGDSFHWYNRNPNVRPEPNTPMVHLPSLRNLYIYCHFFVGQCILKRLTAVDLDLASVKLQPRHELFKTQDAAVATTQFLSRSPKLRDLTILGLHQSTILSGCIRSFYNIEKLHLEFIPALGDIFDRFASNDSFPTRYVKWSVPQLHSIKVKTEFDRPNDDDYDDDDVPVKKIGEFVKARYLSNRRYGEPRAITELIINDRDMLKDARPGEIAPFVYKKRFEANNLPQPSQKKL